MNRADAVALLDEYVKDQSLVRHCNVNRDDIERGAADFGVDLSEHIQFEIDAMKGIVSELGLGLKN